jgi:transcriptional regulator with XRE-family HTH domain
MRELGQELSIGDRVAWYRRRRGISQEVLAGLVNRTADWLSKIENGRANLERLSVIKALADALDVTVADLLGEPSLIHWRKDTSQQAMNQLRESLMSYTALTTSLSSSQPTDPHSLKTGVASTWSAYQAGRFGYAATRVPQLLAGARWLAREGEDGANRIEGQRMLALSFHIAAATLAKVGEAELGWIAADRGFNAAEQAEDPVVLASLMRSVAHSMLSNGHFTAAADIASRSLDQLAAAAEDTPTWWSLLGSLHLVGAMAAARADASVEARASLARAREASQRLGYDGNHAWTSFGPTNVAVHEVSIALELGDMQLALRLAPEVDASPLPLERRVRHRLEVARIHHYAGQPNDSIAAVHAAIQESPEQARYHFITRELVRSWMRDPRQRDRHEVAALAQQLKFS